MAKIINVEFKTTSGRMVCIRPSRVAFIEELSSGHTKVVISNDYSWEVDEEYSSVRAKVFENDEEPTRNVRKPDNEFMTF